jgi:ankyrin repeat protein
MPWTPLHIAIADEADVKVHEMAQDGTILQWLNETDDAGVTPLHLAAETAQTAIVEVRYYFSRSVECAQI